MAKITTRLIVIDWVRERMDVSMSESEEEQTTEQLKGLLQTVVG